MYVVFIVPAAATAAGSAAAAPRRSQPSQKKYGVFDGPTRE
jgi:hypothetical protein